MFADINLGSFGSFDIKSNWPMIGIIAIGLWVAIRKEPKKYSRRRKYRKAR